MSGTVLEVLEEPQQVSLNEFSSLYHFHLKAAYFNDPNESYNNHNRAKMYPLRERREEMAEITYSGKGGGTGIPVGQIIKIFLKVHRSHFFS